MILRERYIINGRDFIRTCSNAGRYVVRDGVAYAEANDPAEFNRQYTEGEMIPLEPATEEEALTRYANSLTGASDPDLISAAETLIEQRIKEEQ